MKRPVASTVVLFAAAATVGGLLWAGWPLVPEGGPSAREEGEEREAPDDWFMRQRAFPSGVINYAAHREAVEQAQAMRAAARGGSAPWQFAGPVNIGGRVTDLAADPANPDFFYVATATGGVFKTTDNGGSFTPIGDDVLSLSIGAVAMRPGDPQTLYVGTGEANGGGGSLTYGGSGVFRTTDGGATFTALGLEETSTIGRILHHPTDPNRLWVAAAGKLFAADGNRGIYRTTDGGATWQRTLFVNDSTGAVDVAHNPNQPDILFAATWERQRRPDERHFGGDGSGLYRSTDGGVTWAEMTNGLPQGVDVGRIGVSFSASTPGVAYAIYADQSGDFRGVFKTVDGGDTWTRTNDGVLGSLYNVFGWWFGNIRVDPQNAATVYVLGLDVYKTTDAGASWNYASGAMHVDQHALWIHPTTTSRLIAGNDGGLYTSTSGGSSWTRAPGGFPITQFYTVEVDTQQPNRLYGGSQDNSTVRTLTGNQNDWAQILGGDGFYVHVDPTNNQFVYAEFQYGQLHRSTNGGSSMTPARSGIPASDRSNWQAPLEPSPQDPATLYFGTHRVWKSTNRAVSWTALSPDLTGGPGTHNLVYGTVTTIAAAPSDALRLYAGTDDGRVWTTANGGTNWTNITAGLPNRWVTRLAVHPTQPQTAYVTLSGYRTDDYLPHVLRTDDAGATWTDRSAGLPEAPVNDVLLDPDDPNRLYVGSDVGVFTSPDGGLSWEALGTSLPAAPILDLDLHDPTRTLVAATFGRSMYRFDLTTINTGTEPAAPSAAFALTAAPNPFRASTTLRFALDRPAAVRAEVFDAAGRRVRVLTTGRRSAGANALAWDGRDGAGAPVAAGAYLVRLTAGDQRATTRLTRVR